MGYLCTPSLRKQSWCLFCSLLSDSVVRQSCAQLAAVLFDVEVIKILHSVVALLREGWFVDDLSSFAAGEYQNYTLRYMVQTYTDRGLHQ